MARDAGPSAYLLSYRSQDNEEDKRLNSQHDVIKHAILGGHLIHPSIPLSATQTSIADIACGTGIWLDDVRKTHFADVPAYEDSAPFLVGFDVNAHAFDHSIASAVKLIEHDCTKEFPSEYIGRFDLVNMRGLAYAVPRESFSHLISNAIKLLRPGGYLQWLETETRLFRQYPLTADFTEAIDKINVERGYRGLVADMPQFMLRELIKPGSDYHPDTMSIINFNLLPGGICRNTDLRSDPVNKRLSETVLESVKLLLAASLEENRQESVTGLTQRISNEERDKTKNLMDAIASSIEVGEVIAGGVFPHLVAQKPAESSL
ncbi:hypothetical protein BKA66DRAFT_567306 [Pyrenochaeta sp. MPI-SDFR-AT-0127]|nr:hypothetical protein BKA66DRAFT_567306 [Pyrenochaeta sp. MPI-SDFR-AT-0127]